jgi:short-subunit dehydrogenase
LVASLAGLVAAYGQSGYAASKHGVIGLASVLRVEWKPKGIHVCVICPPEIDTPMAQEDRRTRPCETTAMKTFAGIVDLDAACEYMIDRIERGQFLIIPGRRARMTWWLHKFLPRALTDAMADRMVARSRETREFR